MTETNQVHEDPLRRQAINILKKRRDFRAHLLIYTLVNAALITTWAITSPGGFFWPIFPLVFWGIGVVMNGWDAYFVDDLSERKIEREMQRLQHKR